MGIISRSIISDALAEVGGMTLEERQSLIDEVRLQQPYLLLSVLIPAQWGATHGQMASLLLLLLTLFTAVKRSGKGWPLMTIETRQQHLMRLIDRLGLASRLVNAEARMAVQKAINTHLQPWLLAYTCDVMENNGWLELQGETHRHLVLTALGLVECAAQGIVHGADELSFTEIDQTVQKLLVGR